MALFIVSIAHAMPGDNCNDPIVISSVPYNEDANSCIFTAEYDMDGSCTGSTTLGPEVVYEFTPPAGDECWALSVGVPFGDWNLVLYILDECVMDPTTCYIGADDYGVGQGEAIWVELEGGHTYYIVIDGVEIDDCGDYNFGVSECVSAIAEDGVAGLGAANLTVSPTITKNHADIRYELAQETYVELSIYSQSGALVKTLAQGNALGTQISTWDTRDANGTLVPQGTYFVTLRSGNDVTLKKLSVLR
jgi:hypothetical protein